jgi:hypothetical protein
MASCGGVREGAGRAAKTTSLEITVPFVPTIIMIVSRAIRFGPQSSSISPSFPLYCIQYYVQCRRKLNER